MANPDEIKKEIKSRDKADCEREHSPLKVSEGAVEIDTTGLTIAEVVEKITSLAK